MSAERERLAALLFELERAGPLSRGNSELAARAAFRRTGAPNVPGVEAGLSSQARMLLDFVFPGYPAPVAVAPTKLEVAAPHSDEKAGVTFWVGGSRSNAFLYSSVPTNFTPSWCAAHTRAYDRACLLCNPDAYRNALDTRKAVDLLGPLFANVAIVEGAPGVAMPAPEDDFDAARDKGFRERRAR